jgi:hypothetical protein
VDFENELLAIGAIRLAERLINSLDRRDIEGIDVDREMKRLTDLARLGRELLGSSAEARWSDDVRVTPSSLPLTPAVAFSVG